MDSSISPFKKWAPVRALALLALVILAWAAGAFYSVHLNPEIRLNVQQAAMKDRWADKMSREYGAKVAVFGGSSCAFSIDGERMLEKYGLPTVNYGRPAGVGLSVMTESVLPYVRPGDTLILAIEPDLLTTPVTATSLGAQFSAALHHSEWAMNPVLGVGRMSWFEFATLLRPGGYHAFTMLGKLFRRGPIFRYNLSDSRASGWMQTDVRKAITGPSERQGHLSDDAITLLTRLRDWCQKHGIRAAYSLPWTYTPAGRMQSFQKADAKLLLEITPYFPVLKDPRLGADPDVDDFADTEFHLVTPAAERRTDGLAEEVLHWTIWTDNELKSIANAP